VTEATAGEKARLDMIWFERDVDGDDLPDSDTLIHEIVE
jgi:hypothetical protein